MKSAKIANGACAKGLTSTVIYFVTSGGTANFTLDRTSAGRRGRGGSGEPTKSGEGRKERRGGEGSKAADGIHHDPASAATVAVPAPRHI